MTTFRIRRELNHPPEQVWAGLTRADLLGRWFMQSDTDLAPDTGFELVDPQARGWSGRLSCRVERFQPHSTLAYRAREVAGTSETMLTWTLTPRGSDGTALLLEHSGWEGARGWLTGMALKLGWGSLVGKKLPTVLTALEHERPE